MKKEGLFLFSFLAQPSNVEQTRRTLRDLGITPNPIDQPNTRIQHNGRTYTGTLLEAISTVNNIATLSAALPEVPTLGRSISCTEELKVENLDHRRN